MLNRDAAEKERRGYRDPKSFVRNDGSEVLFRKDWEVRKIELYMRSNGWCERWTVLHRHHAPGCRKEGQEPHHIKKRWPKRDDRLENLANLSHACHAAEDNRKPRWREHASKATSDLG